MQAIVLAAGRGTRLERLTTHRSKAMLPVAGHSLVGRVLEQLSAAGLSRFIVVGGPDDQDLARETRLFRRTGFPDLSYVIQPEQCGMAHALACAATQIDGPFILCACDNLVSSEFIAEMMVHLRETTADGVLALLRMPPEQLQHSAAVERTPSGRVRRIVEKPFPGSGGDAGSISLYAFRARLLEHLDVPLSLRGEQELQSAIQSLIDAGGDVRGLFAPGRRTVTRPADLLTLNLHYLDQGIATGIQAPLPTDVTLTPPVRVEAGVQVGARCVIGPRVYLEAGCRVGERAVLRDAVVLRGGAVPDGTEVVGRIWAGGASARGAGRPHHAGRRPTG
jgi:NDP-sugar pyrophosphorylase family protein